VVQVTDIIDVPTGVALVMEYINGPNLAEHQRGRALPLEEALELFRGMLLGVAAAHRSNLVHRDLKPENILLQRTELGFVPKLSDFGLVKVLEGSGTKSGIMMGTPEYMAPEQARNAASVDARADLWSLGAILYEMVSGEVAFYRENIVETYSAVVQGDYAPLPDSVPAHVREAIGRLLQVEVDDRFRDVRALFEHLYPDQTRPILPTPPALPDTDDERLRPPVHLLPPGTTLAPPVDEDPAAEVATSPSTTPYASSDERASPRWLGALAVGIAALIAVGLGVAAAVYVSERPVPRPVELSMVGADGEDLAVWVDGQPWSPGQSLGPLLPGAPLEVRWFVGEGCGGCTPTACDDWCAQGSQQLTGSVGPGVQEVELQVTLPAPRPVRVEVSGLSAARIRGGVALDLTDEGAEGEVAPGPRELILERGRCTPTDEGCSADDRCPEGCVSVVRALTVGVGTDPVSVEHEVPALPTAPAPRPSPTPAPPAAAPAGGRAPALVSKGAFKAFVAANPAWERDAAMASGKADAGYLRGGLDGSGPVDRVTWAAAAAYCGSRGGLLSVDADPTTWDRASGVQQEWRQAGGRVAWRRFDGVSSTTASPNQAFPRTGFRCVRP